MAALNRIRLVRKKAGYSLHCSPQTPPFFPFFVAMRHHWGNEMKI
jgi:hypothetical protein